MLRSRMLAWRKERPIPPANTSPHMQPATAHNSTLRLLGLPPELLEMIYGYLNLADQACLSMCSKKLFQDLDTTGYKGLRLGNGHDGHRRVLLTRLARDNSGIIACLLCSHLHAITKVGPVLSWSADLREYRPCSKHKQFLSGGERLPPDCFDLRYALSHCDLTYLHVQLAAKIYKNGLGCGVSLDTLSLTEVFWPSYSKVRALQKVDPEIIRGQLHLRVQVWTIYPQKDPPTFDRRSSPRVCEHIKPPGLEIVLDLMNEYATQASHSCRSVLYRCPACNTEFQLSKAQIDHRKSAVILTKWLNVGNGESMADPHWQQHFFQQWRAAPLVTDKEWSGNRDVFEKHTTRSQETAILENIELLRWQKFRWRLRHIWSESHWVSQPQGIMGMPIGIFRAFCTDILP